MVTENEASAKLATMFAGPLGERLRGAYMHLRLDGRPLRLAFGEDGAVTPRLMVDENISGGCRVVVQLENRAQTRVRIEVVKLLDLVFDIDPGRDLPRTRHLRGSWHYDACYPPRAFVVEEHLHASADHSKRVGIGGINASVYSPTIQFSLGAHPLVGMQLGLEWSGSWEFTAGWSSATFRGEAQPRFSMDCSLGIGELLLEPGACVRLPTIHLCTGTFSSWQAMDDAWRHYLRNGVAARPVAATRFPVSYDHWFGINEHFDLALMLRQARRAARLGCEYFCLDAAWYQSDSFEDGLGNWNRPDSRRFPNGFDDIRKLAAEVRDLGMGFGMWHVIQVGREGTDLPARHPDLYRRPSRGDHATEVAARYGTGDSHQNSPVIDGLRLALEDDDGVALAVETIGGLVRDLDLSWMRFETVAEDGLAYMNGLYSVFEQLRAFNPEMYIEACSGGGQSLDLGMIARANGAWLSDHTTVPSVTRFCQTGALRFIPPEYCNMAVTNRDGGPRPELHAGSLLSRMVGTMSFNGDVASWSEEQSVFARSYVDCFKSFRDRRGERIRFPLAQPRSIEEWDAVAYPDAEGGDLMYLFRDLGPDRLDLATAASDEYDTSGEWEVVLADDGNKIERSAGKTTKVVLAPFSAALLRRRV